MNSEQQVVPEGLSFLHLVWGQEDECEAETDKEFQSLGKKAPACLEQIGTVLSLTDRMASCWWVCRGGDHAIEYLLGRVASNARAALRLLRFGFYDESLVLSRAIGETANLLQLFCHNKDSLQDWRALSRKDRMKMFSPVKVRCRLEELQTLPLINEERYRLLCERAVHVQPETKPQSHNILGVPGTGAILQCEGVLVCLNEIALPTSGAACFGAATLDLEVEVKETIFSAAKDLVNEIGSANITEIDDYHRHVFDNSQARDEIANMADFLRRFQRSCRTRT